MTGVVRRWTTHLLGAVISGMVFFAACVAGPRFSEWLIRALPWGLPSWLADKLAPLFLLPLILYLPLGAASRRWTRNLWVCAVPAGAAMVIAIALFRWALHVTDEGSPAYAYPLVHYLVPSSVTEALLIGASVALACVGWWAADRRNLKQGLAVRA
jgi:hypothetical protein